MKATTFGPLLALLLPLVVATAARADDTYFVIVFGSQRPLNPPKYTHSFATFVRVSCPKGGTPQQQRVQWWTVSWLPRSLDVEVLRLRPECGVNLDLHSTLRWALADRQRVSMWGPYQIRKELFDRAMRQIVLLRSGAVSYKALDAGFPADRVSNCIHALSDLIVEERRFRMTTTGWGESASYFVTLSYQPWLVDPCRTHDWVAGQLGLGRYPLIRRGLDRNPAWNPVVRAAQSVAHQSLKYCPPR
jgi:hypothetical protein